MTVKKAVPLQAVPPLMVQMEWYLSSLCAVHLSLRMGKAAAGRRKGAHQGGEFMAAS